VKVCFSSIVSESRNSSITLSASCNLVEAWKPHHLAACWGAESCGSGLSEDKVTGGKQISKLFTLLFSICTLERHLVSFTCWHISNTNEIRPTIQESPPAFYGTQRFFTVFTTARHCSVSWARCIQSTPSQLISLRSILILSFLPTGLFPSEFPTKIL